MKIKIKEIVLEKNPKLKIIPNFVWKILEWILAIKELNKILFNIQQKAYKNKTYLNGLLFNQYLFEELNLKIKTIGQENIPTDGNFLFASNHPMGGPDAMALIQAIHQIYPNQKIKFIVNDLLMNIKPYEDIFVGINKHGTQARAVAEKIKNLYSEDNQILCFPAGLVSRKIDGEIKDLPWKKGLLKIAQEKNRPIIPVYIEGRNSELFYTIARITKKLGLPKLEMTLLARELLKKRNQTITIKFGKPITKNIDIYNRVYQMVKYL